MLEVQEEGMMEEVVWEGIMLAVWGEGTTVEVK